MDRAPTVPIHVALPAGLAERLQRVASLGKVDRERVVLEAIKNALPALEQATGASLRIARCPRCGARPQVAKVDGVGLAACRKCGGVWLDNASASVLARAPSETVESVAAQLAEQAPAPQPVDDALACPVCRQAMARADHPGVGALDTCSLHGTFFDGGELEAMVIQLRQQQANRAAMSGAQLDVDLQGVDDLQESVFREGRTFERFFGGDD